MADKDYYKTLGVDKKASQAEIKKAFRKLAVKHHPDKNPNDKQSESKFHAINEANNVLSDVEKRKKYDEYGENWEHHEQYAKQRAEQQARQGSSNPFGNANQQYYEGTANDMFGGGGQSEYSDLFEQFFGGRSAGGARSQGRGQSSNGNFGSANPKGNDYETELLISLEEAYSGTHRIIQLDNEKLKVTTKPGAYTGLSLHIKNKGAVGNNGAARGDLFVKITVAEQTDLTRKGNDLYHTQTIDLYTAILGGQTVVNTLSGSLNVTITAGIQNGKTMRLKGKGMPLYNKPTQNGDFYIQLQVVIPEKITPEQKILFQELQSIQTQSAV
jgi:curved DNA-binding protein